MSISSSQSFYMHHFIKKIALYAQFSICIQIFSLRGQKLTKKYLKFFVLFNLLKSMQAYVIYTHRVMNDCSVIVRLTNMRQLFTEFDHKVKRN